MVAEDAVLWWPEALHHVASEPEMLEGWAYVVLEELVDERIELMAWSWPLADRGGHLFWPSDDEQDPLTVAVNRDVLRRGLYRSSRLRRVPRLGDTFAAEKLGPAWAAGGTVDDVRTLFEGWLFDISAEAREAAKLAYHGAVAPVPALSQSSDLGARLLSQAAQRRSRVTAKALSPAAPAHVSRRKGQRG